jgi:hypothetical protein
MEPDLIDPPWLRAIVVLTKGVLIYLDFGESFVSFGTPMKRKIHGFDNCYTLYSL